MVRPASTRACALTLGRGWGRHRVFGIVHHDEGLIYGGQCEQTLDSRAPSYDGEVVSILTRVVVLADHFAESPGVHKRQPAQVQDDVTDTIRVGSWSVERIGDLGGRGDVKFAAKLDQCSPAMNSSLNFKDVRRIHASVGS